MARPPAARPCAPARRTRAGGQAAPRPKTGRALGVRAPEGPKRAPAESADALQRLRTLKGWIGSLDERPWTEVVGQFARRQAGMMIMGDWAKPELAEHGMAPDRDYGCAAAPGTARYHLYSVDTLAMFAGD